MSFQEYETKFEHLVQAGGDGLWGSVKKTVHLRGLVLLSYDDGEFGELRIYFDADKWVVKRDECFEPGGDGLLYTDKTFEANMRTLFESMGIVAANIGGSEYGMQGDDYVSFDVDERFIDTSRNLFMVAS